MVRYKSLKARILANLKETESGCIEWQRHRTKDGYGRMSIWSKEEQKVKKKLVTRTFWEIVNGPIPEGLFVCHKCDNPPCCNIDHLFLGTIDDNAQDWVNKGLSHKGTTNPASKLNNDTVSTIKYLYGTGSFSQQELADVYKCSQHNISLIIRGKKWKHIKAA